MIRQRPDPVCRWRLPTDEARSRGGPSRRRSDADRLPHYRRGCAARRVHSVVLEWRVQGSWLWCRRGAYGGPRAAVPGRGIPPAAGSGHGWAGRFRARGRERRSGWRIRLVWRPVRRRAVLALLGRSAARTAEGRGPCRAGSVPGWSPRGGVRAAAGGCAGSRAAPAALAPSPRSWAWGLARPTFTASPTAPARSIGPSAWMVSSDSRKPGNRRAFAGEG